MTDQVKSLHLLLLYTNDPLAYFQFLRRFSRNSYWKGLEVILTFRHSFLIINLALELVTLPSTKRIGSSMRSQKA